MKTERAEALHITSDVTTAEMTTDEVMADLYRAMAFAQAHIIERLRNAASDEHLKTLAVEIIEELKKLERDNPNQYCGNGTVWNPITRQCE